MNCSFVKTAYHLSKRSVEETFLRIRSFLLINDTWAKIFSGISTKTSLRCRQNCFRPVHCNVLWQKFFLSKIVFSHHFRTFSKNFVCFFSETFSVNLTKLHSTSPKEKFEDKTLFWQRFCFFFFHVLPKLNGDIMAFFASKNNRQVWHNSLPRIQEDFLKKNFLKKFFFWSLGNEQLLYVISSKNCRSVVSTAFCCQFGQLAVKKKFVKYFFPIIFGHESQIDQSLFEFFRPSGRNCFLQVRRIN